MDFQDRFRDRSCLITKNGLQSIISAPGNPIQKSNTSLGPSFFIPHGHMRNISHEFQGPKPQAANPSNTLCDNSIYSTFSRLPHSRQSPAGRARPRIIPLNGLGFPQNTWFDRLPREKEIEKDPRIETSNSRVPSLRAIEQGVESFYRGSKTARLKEKSIDVSKSRRETDYRDDSIPTVENERLGVNRSQDGKENKRWMENFANRMAMGPMRRGISVETFGNKRELMEYSNPGTMRMKNLFPQNDVGERRSVYNNILPQLEKVYHYDASSSKAVLASFREKTSQGSGYLIEHFNKVDVSNNLDQKRPVTKGIKTRSCDKVPKEVEMEESEILKRNRKDSREMKITSQAKAARKIRLNTLQREVEPEFQKLIKKVSFREGAEMIAGRNGSKQKEMRFAVGKRVRSENRE